MVFILFFSCFLYPNHLHLYIIGVGEEGGKEGGKKGKWEGRKMGRKRERNLGRNGVTKESLHICNFFFFKTSLVMHSVLYRVLFRQG